jgi:hypothetical protein
MLEDRLGEPKPIPEIMAKIQIEKSHTSVNIAAKAENCKKGLKFSIEMTEDAYGYNRISASDEARMRRASWLE